MIAVLEHSSVALLTMCLCPVRSVRTVFDLLMDLALFAHTQRLTLWALETISEQNMNRTKSIEGCNRCAHNHAKSLSVVCTGLAL